MRGPGHGHHVEAGRVFQQIVPLQVSERQPSEPPLLLGIDRFSRMAGLVRAAGFDLDEDDRAAIDGHQVQFAQPAAVSTGDDLIAQPPQKAFGGPFAALTPANDSAARRCEPR